MYNVLLKKVRTKSSVVVEMGGVRVIGATSEISRRTCVNFVPAGPLKLLNPTREEDTGASQVNARLPETVSVWLGLMDLPKLAEFLVTSSNLAQTHSLIIMLDSSYTTYIMHKQWAKNESKN